MKKREWFWIIGLVFATWTLDQLTKAWANSHLSAMHFYGPVGLVLTYNRGAILGTFSDLPPMLRVVSLSTGGAFLVFIYGAIQYLLTPKSMPLRIGMSLLLGGILGNVTDRIVRGAITDFILFGVRNHWTPAFNIADAVQWFGYGLVVYGLLRDGRLLWPDANSRRSLWVNPRFQLKYMATIVLIGSSFSVVAGVFAYTFIKVTIDALIVGPPQVIERRFLVPFLETYTVISVGFLIALVLLSRILSHRTAGPVYAFEAYLRDLMRGKDRSFRVRGGDEFKQLEKLGEEVRALLKTAHERREFVTDLPHSDPADKKVG